MTFSNLGVLLLVVLVKGGSCFKLTIYHTNDIHARYNERGHREGGACKDEVGSCYGGMARHSTFFKKVREQKAADDAAGVENNYLILSAGDWFTGTVYYNINRGNLTAHFLSSLGYDAFAYGNHEFDNGPQNLEAAMSNITPESGVSLLSANMDVGSSNVQKEDFMIKEFVFQGKTTKVGVIGHTTPETKFISSPGPDITFNDVVPAIREQVVKLKEQGVEVIVALGHSGIEVDKAICDQVDGVDIVVGGHTNTFLANQGSDATFPDGARVEEMIEGPYPMVRHGGKCVVVQAYAYGKFMGQLETEFNDAGELTKSSGDPILMWGDDWPQDPGVLTFLVPFTAQVEQYGNIVLGTTTKDVDGTRIICRFRECGMGNLISDANVESFKRNDPSVVCGMVNSGGIRAGIEFGDITYQDVLTVLPFGNTIDKAVVSGATLNEAFEHSVSTFNSTGFNVGAQGRFLQVSGLKVHLDLTKEVGKRVRSLLILNPGDGTYEPIQDDKEYPCVFNSFMLSGGDGYSMLSNLPRVTGQVDGDVLAQYIQGNTPLDGNAALKNIPSRVIFEKDLSGTSELRCSIAIILISLLSNIF